MTKQNPLAVILWANPIRLAISPTIALKSIDNRAFPFHANPPPGHLCRGKNERKPDGRAARRKFPQVLSSRRDERG